jgi:sulfoacetaldehyde acetyltransferase
MNSLQEIVTNIREDIPITYVVFVNRQWGAEKKNQVLWFGDRYLGTNLDYMPSWAAVAKTLGAEGIRVDHVDNVAAGFKEAIRLQMEEKKTCVLELILNRELSDPFRRDAMTLPGRHLSKYKSTDVFEESKTGHPADTERK